ncbi:hypothetical protein EAS54_32340 [Bradyrhizobium guangzhouense]|nr:hypothetical protein EAS54_32340 [Bradyrhizobium guangzhouense]
MGTTLIDRIASVTFQNGILRVDCIAAGPNNEERASGTLLIPANQAHVVLQSLIGAAQELDRRMRGARLQTDAGKPDNVEDDQASATASPRETPTSTASNGSPGVRANGKKQPSVN